VHCQRANVAAGELQRLHGEAVGGDHHVARRQIDARGVGVGVEHRIGEVAREDALDQHAHPPPAVAVRQGEPVGKVFVGHSGGSALRSALGRKCRERQKSRLALMP